ncbi:malto-oligosyltrehalose trehalohydrolase [Deinococcus sp. QL22]|uniref:malto-oligosyltrehalose trehalohydrolase n=1 Tax=Deinococcus sp. QL22 TaxID=2939437 RepID=UPI002016AE47|nr:malto-oligosyltrehalose trehalohydrolase [Deinococcus sp. QL22]UQN09269.1 malto-oligosyltrehalose trehalohydrolase [Deinococcus sp. QL22]
MSIPYVSERAVSLSASPLGAFLSDQGLTFRLWSSHAQHAAVVLYQPIEEQERRMLAPHGQGMFEATFPDLGPGTRYKFELDGQLYPDPYARWLPDGVHGPSTVVESNYLFQHARPQHRPDELVIYELHIGTFTPEGTYRAAAERLPHLRDLGITCLELLPLSSFPGRWGWGYDGVAHFAPFAPYGTPEELQAFIDQAHGYGLTVLLDMVYNHFGPDGNYLSAYSPEYFTSAHPTPWGTAPDYTQPFMRRLTLDSALHWLHTYRFDGFRLDATHAIVDPSAEHLLRELARVVHDYGSTIGNRLFLFCEDDRNLPDLVTHDGMDGVWADDFHHQVRVLLTGQRDGYYAGYQPSVTELARCIDRGWLYEGQYWLPGQHHPRGRRADALEGFNFVYCIQNHDQIGNRAWGERLQDGVGQAGFWAASVLLLFLPMTPLLFQGQEWMAQTPFQFFSDHQGELGRQVSEGRKAEFADFEAFGQGEGVAAVPDPQASSTFQNSKLNWRELSQAPHVQTLRLYQDLLRLRRDDPVLNQSARQTLRAGSYGDLLWVERRHAGERRVLLVNFSDQLVPLSELDALALGNALSILRTGEGSPTVINGKEAVILAATL